MRANYLSTLGLLAIVSISASCRRPMMASRPLTPEEAEWSTVISRSYVGWKRPSRPVTRHTASGPVPPPAAAPAPVAAPPMPAVSDNPHLAPAQSGVQPVTITPVEEIELVPVDSPSSGGQDAATTYTVQRGDTLMSIARKHYGSAKEWRKILDHNRDKISSPSQLKPGMQLKVPN